MFKFKNILVATDFSDVSQGAAACAREIAVRFDARLHLLHVIEEPLVPAVWAESFVAELPGLRAEMEADARARLENILTPGDRERARYEVVTRFGLPFQEILSYARTEQIDLIVMGTHGRGAIAHLLMGSVAERVVRHAPCPVLTVGPRPAISVARDAEPPAAPAGG